MRTVRYWLILFSLIGTIFIFAVPDAKESLADLYKSGKVRFIPELTIDETSMPEDTFFESAFDIVCDKDGNVYVCDYRANNIKKFDSSGNFIKTIGRQGQGPGEFNRPIDMIVTNDRLFVWELGNRRLSILTLSGEIIKSFNIQISKGWLRKMRSLPNGDIVMEREKIYYGSPPKPQECLIEIYTPDFELKKTVYTQQVWRNKYKRFESGFTNIIQPFSPAVYWDVSPDGKIIIGYSKNYEIEIHDSEKGKISSFTHPYKPVKVTAKDKETFFAGISYSIGGVKTQGVPDFIVENTEFPKFKPPFFNILIDSESNILVSAHMDTRADELKNFDVFNAQGKFISNVQIIGEVSFPFDVIIRRETFWLRRTDEEGLIKAVKYRISDMSIRKEGKGIHKCKED